MRLAVSAITLLVLTAGEAAAQTVLLPSPTTPLDDKLPLRADAPPVPPFLPANARVSNDQLVSVDVHADGGLRGVRVRQRLELRGLGDFFFQVQAPVRDVRAGPGSQAEPGFRRTAILWQGFVGRHRVLVAVADLVPRGLARVMPLRLELDGRTLRLRNATAVRAEAFSAPARPRDVRAVLDSIAAQPLVQPSMPVQGPVRRRRVVVEAPLRVRGVIREGGRVVQRFARILGGDSPDAAAIPIRTVRPLITVDAEPVRILPASTSGRDPVLHASTSLLRLARVHQYNTFLGGPDPDGPARAVYRYRVVSQQTAAAPRRPDEGRSTALVVVLATGAVVGAGGLVALWARL